MTFTGVGGYVCACEKERKKQRQKEKGPKGKVDYRSVFPARLAIQTNIFFQKHYILLCNIIIPVNIIVHKSREGVTSKLFSQVIICNVNNVSCK